MSGPAANIPGGWIKLHRCLAEHDLWLNEPFTRGQAWADLLLLANHKPGHIRRRGVGITVKRGQVGHSQEALAARWKWSRGKVIRFLNELKTAERITVETGQKNLAISALITITNHDIYQGGGTEDGTEDGTGTRSKEVKKIKEPLKISLNGQEYTIPDYFEKLWKVYPKKVDKPTALKKFLATVKTQEDADDINTALGSYLEMLRGEEWRKPQDGSRWFANWRGWLSGDQEETDAA